MTFLHQPDSTLLTQRLLPFSPEQVFAAFQNPEKLAQWWGPDGFTNTFQSFDFRPGGHWVFIMHGPNGADYPNENVFHEIIPATKIIIDHIVAPLFQLIVTLEPRGEQTLLIWSQCFETPALMEGLRAIFEPANEQNLDRLKGVCAAGNP